MRIYLSLLCVSLFILSGCTEAQLVAHAVKNIPAGERSQGDFKVGKPYKVAGRWYNPRETYSFSQTGAASWYGPNFHGKKTANGETFDMNELTAAHKTLQLPSLVRVTNLENGRSIVVRINDRGPFSKGRILDVSKRSAELLGFKGQGTAKVKIDLLPEESRRVAEAAKRGIDTRGMEIDANQRQYAQATVQPRHQQQARAATPATTSTTAAPRAQTQPPPSQQRVASYTPAARNTPPRAQQQQQQQAVAATRTPPHTASPVSSPDSIYVQAGSFGDKARAMQLAQSLSPYGQANIYPALISGQTYYRVRLGPVPDVQSAGTLISQLELSGRSNAIIVVE